VNTRTDVAIIGAGLAGLTAAIALARSGLDVTVIEMRQSQGPDYWGLTIWPSGVAALDWLGVGDRVRADGCRLAMMRWLGATGREWTSVDLDRIRDVGDFIGILPSRLVAALSHEAARHNVRILSGVTDWTLDRSDGAPVIQATAGGETLTIGARLILGADGPASALRERIGVRYWRWRPPAQAIVSGIGGRLAFAEMRQALGPRWSAGCLALGHGQSWVYTIVPPEIADAASIRQYGVVDPGVAPSIADIQVTATFRPWSVRVREWARDRVLLIGDAAHTLLPHIGLGGNLTLEDVPILTDVVATAFRIGDLTAKALGRFQRLRRQRLSYVRRISELWGVSTMSSLPGVEAMRDVNMWRLSRQPRLLETFIHDLASARPVPLRTRLGVWLP
jgi:2-polyprenyl-6-methoxyphenol hydroxylase-like FAD-dependent oxidoreductase